MQSSASERTSEKRKRGSLRAGLRSPVEEFPERGVGRGRAQLAPVDVGGRPASPRQAKNVASPDFNK